MASHDLSGFFFPPGSCLQGQQWWKISFAKSQSLCPACLTFLLRGNDKPNTLYVYVWAVGGLGLPHIFLVLWQKQHQNVCTTASHKVNFQSVRYYIVGLGKAGRLQAEAVLSWIQGTPKDRQIDTHTTPRHATPHHTNHTNNAMPRHATPHQPHQQCHATPRHAFIVSWQFKKISN